MNSENNIMKSIAERTNGDVYIGIVGPVRTGKSSFIKKFMEKLVIPQMENSKGRERATDELPQSSGGKTIMTTEPKFVPEKAEKISFEDGSEAFIRLIDCVGYIVPSSKGYAEEGEPRMVMTPWFDEEIPFNMAAELGTKKVITEHSSMGIVVTSDGSFTDIPRKEYEEAEERTIAELKEIGKPFIVLLNCENPSLEENRELQRELMEKYGCQVRLCNCLELEKEDILDILGLTLREFPVRELGINLPFWVSSLPKEHKIKNDITKRLRESFGCPLHIRELEDRLEFLLESEFIKGCSISSLNLGKGTAIIDISLGNGLLYDILKEETGIEIDGEEMLIPTLKELAKIKREFEKYKGALEEVNQIGYGIVMPSSEELSLEKPEIIKKGGKYGVRLKASAPSIHMMRADIKTEVSPIVGSEKQSKDLANYLLSEFEQSPEKIWESNIFGKSIHELVNEGLRGKLYNMPSGARIRLQETTEKIINEGCNGLICIIL